MERPAIPGSRRKLPARLTGLARVATIVIASTPSSPAEPLSTTPWPLRLRLRLVDSQCPSPECGSVQRCDSFLGLSRIRHFHKRKASRAAGFSVGHDAHFFHLSVGLEKGAQLRLACAVG